MDCPDAATHFNVTECSRVGAQMCVFVKSHAFAPVRSRIAASVAPSTLKMPPLFWVK